MRICCALRRHSGALNLLRRCQRCVTEPDQRAQDQHNPTVVASIWPSLSRQYAASNNPARWLRSARGVAGRVTANGGMLVSAAAESEQIAHDQQAIGEPRPPPCCHQC